MAYENQQQRPQAAKKGSITREIAEAISVLTDDCLLRFTPDEVSLIWDICPDPCLINDFKRFVYVASAKGLNPVLNDLHMEYRFDRESGAAKMAIVTHQDGLLKIAHRSKQLDGITQTQAKDERGYYVETQVHKKDCGHPFTFRAYMTEFNQGRGVWGKMEYNMLAKCSRAGGLRLGFPEETGGIYTPEEMDNFGSDEPGTPGNGNANGQTYAIGEKPAPAAPKPEPVAASVAATPEPAPPPVAPAQPYVNPTYPQIRDAEPAQAVAASVAATPAPDPKPMAPNPENDARKQYAARLKVIITSQEWGVTKAEMDQVLLGYFGVKTKADLPKDPAAFLGLLDDVIQRLGEPSGAPLALLKDDPLKFGAYRAAAHRQLAAGPVGPPPNPPADANTVPPAVAQAFLQVKEKFPAWKDDLCAIVARVMAKHDAELDKIEALVASDLMAKFTEPQIETAFLIGYYDPDGLLAILKNFQRTKMPMMWFQQEIQTHVGKPLAGFDCDPKKVAEGVGKALAGAK